MNRLRSSNLNNRSDESCRDLYNKSDEFRRYRYYERYDKRTLAIKVEFFYRNKASLLHITISAYIATTYFKKNIK